jgi:hypothetical protein
MTAESKNCYVNRTFQLSPVLAAAQQGARARHDYSRLAPGKADSRQSHGEPSPLLSPLKETLRIGYGKSGDPWTSAGLRSLCWAPLSDLAPSRSCKGWRSCSLSALCLSVVKCRDCGQAVFTCDLALLWAQLTLE